jgi:hypothetical protein
MRLDRLHGPARTRTPTPHQRLVAILPRAATGARALDVKIKTRDIKPLHNGFDMTIIKRQLKTIAAVKTAALNAEGGSEIKVSALT